MTRFPARLATGMHGPEPRVPERRASAGQLPIWRFSRRMAQCLPAHCSFLSETGPDARNGLSLSCNGSRFHGSHSRVNVPDLLLRFQRYRFLARSAFCSTAGSVRPSPAASSLQPVACSRSRLVGSPAISTPLQDFYLPPDQSVRLTSGRLARLPVPPDFLSLPAPIVYY